MSSHAPSQRLTVLTYATLVVAIVALCLAAWPLLFSSADDHHSDAGVADATSKVCAAYDLAFRGVKLQTNQVTPADPSELLATAANARIALVGASDSLIAAIDDSPAAPAGLRDAVKQLAGSYRTAAMNYLAGEPTDSPAVKAAVVNAGNAATTIDLTCKK